MNRDRKNAAIITLAALGAIIAALSARISLIIGLPQSIILAGVGVFYAVVIALLVIVNKQKRRGPAAG